MIDRSLGICFGATTVSIVILEEDAAGRPVVEFTARHAHHGDPRRVMVDFLERHPLAEFRHVAVTGRRFVETLDLTSVTEPEAVEAAIAHLELAGKCDAVVSLGGETFFAYFLDPEGRIARVETGGKCASGTGEFFLQQIGRMNLDLAEAVPLAELEAPHHVSGRCSVFCKSDCTHALNIGTPPGAVAAGLTRMMAEKIDELLAKGAPRRLVVTGGVALNRGVLRFLRERHPHLYVPAEAAWFEALGAALIARARRLAPPAGGAAFKSIASRFSRHPSLADFIDRVDWKSAPTDTPRAGDVTILGLDVGSTTTKAMLVRVEDAAPLASVYLRTNGRPVRAATECYAALASQITVPIRIIGLGVTGSGRMIAGLHALTDGIVNEIVAHAAAAVHFDPEVETIFEIGGQDAKYTSIVNRVAIDYAMNEACSAGTGSFLEEAAGESLGVKFTEIGGIALAAKNPPNFNDQCAAFIGSDIKTALQEGMSREEIVAGLVYSVCLNYVNRVKGNRAVGRTVFLQGGVCYNRAVPVAMAALTGARIVVPPDPGLMGAFGAALMIRERLSLGLAEPGDFKLDELAQRPFSQSRTFRCRGAAEKCDRRCEIAMIRIGDKEYPFGGACDKYNNRRKPGGERRRGENLVSLRQHLVFEKYAKVLAPRPGNRRKTVGICRSFLVNTLYPLYYNFFTLLGFRVILSGIDPEGTRLVGAPFCYPVELAHGAFVDLLAKEPDYIFLPQVTEVHTAEQKYYQRTCVFVQGEPYYLLNRFRDRKLPIPLTPVLNFADGYDKAVESFAALAKSLGRTKAEGRAAYRKAATRLQRMLAEFKRRGAEAIADLERSGEDAIVLFGRAYNSFASEADFGIPQKIASRGLTVIPHDFLPSEKLESYPRMYWGNGAQILRGARLVADHPRLFGVFVTNFSCGPDSFLLSYFRAIMGEKPSLTLELDSHSADAGVNTRIDAALDIFTGWRRLREGRTTPTVKPVSRGPLRPVPDRKFPAWIDAEGREYAPTDPDLRIIIPSMGDLSTEAFAAAFKSHKIDAIALPPPDAEVLRLGRTISTGKECLPFTLLAGSLLRHLETRTDNRPTLFFLPTGGGPCRLGQYSILLQDIIDTGGFDRVGLMTLSDENGYGGLGAGFTLTAWKAVVLGDAFEEIRNALRALAVDPTAALKTFAAIWRRVPAALASGNGRRLDLTLAAGARRLRRIPLRRPLKDAPTIALVGEIYARRDSFSRHDLMERLVARGFVVRVAPIAEYIHYCAYIGKRPSAGLRIPFTDRLRAMINDPIQRRIEERLRRILARSGLVASTPLSIHEVIGHASHLVGETLLGETILTVGAALKEIHEVCGVVSIGPFACMPSRLAESILGMEMTEAGQERAARNADGRAPKPLRSETPESKAMEPFQRGETALPFLALETDGNPFPLILTAKIETFMLQAERLHRKRMA